MTNFTILEAFVDQLMVLRAGDTWQIWIIQPNNAADRSKQFWRSIFLFYLSLWSQFLHFKQKSTLGHISSFK